VALVSAVEAPSAVPQLAVGTLAGITLATLYGFVPYIVSPPPLNPVEGRLLFEPLGYANGVGIYAAIGIVLSIGLALAARQRRERLLALLPLVALIPALYFTSSRGAWVALAAGLTVTLYLGGYVRVPVVVAFLAAAVVAGAVLGSRSGQPLSLFGANRPHYWHVAWSDYTSHSLLGSGAGTYADYWLHHRKNGEFVRDAHSLYLESLAELGPVGLGLVALALGAPLVALRRRADGIVAAAAGAYVAFVVHAAVDWDWELPAVTLTGLVCGGAVLLGTRRGGQQLQPPLRLLLVAAVIAGAVFTVVRLQESGDFRL
jgi:hypothetical protein